MVSSYMIYLICNNVLNLKQKMTEGRAPLLALKGHCCIETVDFALLSPYHLSDLRHLGVYYQ